MVGFKATLINETEKLYKKKKLLVAAIVSLIFIILGQLSMVGLRSGFGIRGASGTDFPILVLSLLVNSILPLFTALVTIDSFSAEFSQNTMKITLTRPITRLKLFTAKIGAITIFIFFNLIFVMLFSSLMSFILNSSSFTLHGVIKILISYLVSIVPMIVLSLVIVLFANILKSGIGVFFLSILVFLVFKVLGLVFSGYSAILFTSMMDWYTLWIMDDISFLKIFRQFIMMLSYAILLFTGSYYLFDKRDF